MNKLLGKIYKVIIINVFLGIIFFNSTNVYANNELSINARAALIIEVNSGKIICEDNIEMKNYPASLTKILTAILVLENCKLNEMVTVSEWAISNVPKDYVDTPLFAGEKISVEDLLYALLLKSANDAAYVLAEYVGGSVNNFSNMMNKKAEELGCRNSHFVNPNGIHDNNHYTTAYDMYLIAKYAMENQTFAKIVSTYQYALYATNKYPYNDRIMENSNFFLCPNSKYYDKNVTGVKTGTTSQAKNCLITEVRKNGFDFFTVILGAETKESRFSETRKMINYMLDNYTHTIIHKKGDIIKTIEVENATNSTKNVNLIISEEIKVFNNIKIKIDDVEPEIILKENIIAPINKNDELGTINYTVDGLEYSAKLLAEDDVEQKTYYVEVIICIGTLIILCFLIVMKKKSRRK